MVSSGRRNTMDLRCISVGAILSELSVGRTRGPASLNEKTVCAIISLPER